MHQRIIISNFSLVFSREAHRELWPHFRLHSQVLGYCPPLLVLLGDDGELEPLVVLEEGEHAGGDLGVRGLHPSKGGVSATRDEVRPSVN